MSLQKAEAGKSYIIRKIHLNDEELTAFLFSLGCYEGEPVSVVLRLKKTCIVSIKDSRYSIDLKLADAIEVAAA